MNPVFSIEHLILTLTVLVAGGTLLSWWSAFKAGRKVRVWVTLLRLGALAGLCVPAINPGSWRENRLERNDGWAVLVDVSESMSVADIGGKQRIAEAGRLAKKLSGMAEERDSVDIYSFASEIVPSADKSGQDFSTAAGDTDIVRSGMQVLARHRSGGRRLTGMVVISDGRQVRSEASLKLSMAARAQDVPIYSVVLGGRVERRNMVVTAQRRQYTAFKGQKLKIRGVVENSLMGRVSTMVELLDGKGHKIGEKSVKTESGKRAEVEFQITPAETGYYDYRLRIAPLDGESLVSDNESGLGVVVLGSRIRVLMLEGNPHWDSKFLSQLLRKQPNLDVTGIYRVADERFFRIGSGGDDIGKKTDEIFPASAADLEMYDLVIFGRGAEYFLTSERVHMLKNFVRNHGGSILFARGKPYADELPELAGLEPCEWGEAVSGSIRLRPAAAGVELGLFGDVLPDASDEVWKVLPPISQARRCRKLKGFGRVLMEGELDIGGGHTEVLPMVFGRRYGKGMVVAVGAGGLWKWGFFPRVKAANEMYRDFWLQMVEWISTYSEFLPGYTYALRLSSSTVRGDTPVRVRISHRGVASGAGEALELRVYSEDKCVQKQGLDQFRGSGTISALRLNKPGNYRVELVDVSGGKSVGPSAALRVLPPPCESDNYSADPDFLKNLAEESGGRVVDESDFDELVKKLEPKRQEVDLSKAVWDPSWDVWWLLCWIAACFGIEIFIRRRNGLI